MGDFCFQCGAAIASEGIHHRSKLFCSDGCCEEFEEEFVTNGEPDLDELEEEDFEDSEDFDFEEDADEDEDSANDFVADDDELRLDDY